MWVSPDFSLGASLVFPRAETASFDLLKTPDLKLVSPSDRRVHNAAM
jgi:hypothetical protein